MMKQILLPIAGVAVFIAAVGMFMQKSGSLNVLPLISPSPPQVTSSKTLTIENKVVKVEISDTDALRAKGLSGRTSLPPDSGMLFVFDNQNVVPTFWMKNMLMPIDIIWVNNGAIVKIDKNVQAPTSGVPDAALQTYKPEVPIDYVLEVEAGFSDKNNFKVGSPVTLPTL